MPAWFGYAADSPADKSYWLQAWGSIRDLVSVSYLQRAIFGVMRDMGLDVALEYNEGLFSVDLALFLQPTRPGGERRKVCCCDSAQLHQGKGGGTHAFQFLHVVACPVGVEIVLLHSAMSCSSPGLLQLWLTPWALSGKSMALSWAMVAWPPERSAGWGSVTLCVMGLAFGPHFPSLVVRGVMVRLLFIKLCVSVRALVLAGGC